MPFWTKLYNDREYASTNRTYEHAFYIPSKYQVRLNAVAVAMVDAAQSRPSFSIEHSCHCHVQGCARADKFGERSHRKRLQSPPLTKSGWCMSQAAALTQGNSVALQQVHWSSSIYYTVAY